MRAQKSPGTELQPWHKARKRDGHSARVQGTAKPSMSSSKGIYTSQPARSQIMERKPLALTMGLIWTSFANEFHTPSLDVNHKECVSSKTNLETFRDYISKTATRV